MLYGRYFIVSISCLLGLLLFIIAIKKKWLASITLGKGGIDVKAAEVEKKFQTGTFNKFLDDSIVKLDHELINYAVQKSHELRRTFTRELASQIECTSARRALISVLRFPIYERCRNDDFKKELKTENIKYYVKRIIKDVRAEYEDFVIEKNNAVCPLYNNSCTKIPPMKEVVIDLEKRILEDWALPIRIKNISICEAKIKLYEQFLDHFTASNDQIRIKRTEYCIEKNKAYIAALKKNSEDGDGVF